LLKALLAARPALERQDRNGRRAIWYAAAAADSGAVELLLAAGASVSDSKPGASPVFAAITAGSVDSVHRLLRRNAPVDPADASAATALMYAAQTGSTEVISALIAAGAEVNRQDDAGDTALIIAARSGHIEACRLLLRAGANVALRNADRLSAPDVARRAGFADLAELLD
jgi:ankyrin repeat protein